MSQKELEDIIALHSKCLTSSDKSVALAAQVSSPSFASILRARNRGLEKLDATIPYEPTGKVAE